jgi:hypothetical protein
MVLNYIKFIIEKLIVVNEDFQNSSISDKTEGSQNFGNSIVTDESIIIKYLEIKNRGLLSKKKLKDEEMIMITDSILDKFKCYNIIDYYQNYSSEKEQFKNSYKLMNQYKNYFQKQVKVEEEVDCCSKKTDELPKLDNKQKKTIKKNPESKNKKCLDETLKMPVKILEKIESELVNQSND